MCLRRHHHDRRLRCAAAERGAAPPLAGACSGALAHGRLRLRGGLGRDRRFRGERASVGRGTFLGVLYEPNVLLVDSLCGDRSERSKPRVTIAHSVPRIFRVAEPPSPQRSETREIIELRRLKEGTAGARDRRSTCRSSCCSCIAASVARAAALDPARQITSTGSCDRSGLQFEHLPIDWSDIRFLLRATA